MKSFNEEQIRAIIRRETELQEMPNSNAGGRGLTIEDLEEIGKASGLDAELIRQAAAEVSENLVTDKYRSSDTHVYVERMVSGKTSEELWQDILAEMRHTYGASFGTILEDKSSFEWAIQASLA